MSGPLSFSLSLSLLLAPHAWAEARQNLLVHVRNLRASRTTHIVTLQEEEEVSLSLSPSLPFLTDTVSLSLPLYPYTHTPSLSLYFFLHTHSLSLPVSTL